MHFEEMGSGILIYLLLRSLCKITEPYLTSFWYTRNGEEKKRVDRKRSNNKNSGHSILPKTTKDQHFFITNYAKGTGWMGLK